MTAKRNLFVSRSPICDRLSKRSGIAYSIATAGGRLMDQSIAYHEAGHAVVAAWLGAEVVSVTLQPDDDDGPRRDGDAAIRWHHRGLSPRELCQRELMAVLAGPVAEMIHSGESWGIHQFPQWAADWELSRQLAAMLVPTVAHIDPLIEFTIQKLERLAAQEAFWQTIAEVADLLEAFETIDGEQVKECLDRWLGGASGG